MAFAFGIERIEKAVKHLTEQITCIGDALRDGLTETRSRIDALAHTHTDLGNRIDDARRNSEANSRDIAAARRELADLHRLIESRRADAAEALAAPPAGAGPGFEPEPEPDPLPDPLPAHDLDAEPLPVPLDDSPHDHDPHDDLLAQAAGIANAELVCHRDTWAFLTEQASGGEHFRMPVDITPAGGGDGSADRGTDRGTDRGGGRNRGTVRIGLSGRSLLGLADALWQVTQSLGTSPGTHHLAAQTYNRIQGALAHAHGGPGGPGGPGGVVRIVIDDRVPYDEYDDHGADDDGPGDHDGSDRNGNNRNGNGDGDGIEGAAA
ncbi:hypothetical protein [Streptomyces sp. HNM0575]|uniref:hypothetical protein n=1 Tax=Streptomyces sp. HNM0575 TaxID=2716338 RepID=UPI0019CF5E5C|nr:hypothetical protein [Streptomyces sp. HNM0575]